MEKIPPTEHAGGLTQEIINPVCVCLTTIWRGVKYAGRVWWLEEAWMCSSELPHFSETNPITDAEITCHVTEILHTFSQKNYWFGFSLKASLRITFYYREVYIEGVLNDKYALNSSIFWRASYIIYRRSKHILAHLYPIPSDSHFLMHHGIVWPCFPWHACSEGVSSFHNKGFLSVSHGLSSVWLTVQESIAANLSARIQVSSKTICQSIQVLADAQVVVDVYPKGTWSWGTKAQWNCLLSRLSKLCTVNNLFSHV